MVYYCTHEYKVALEAAELAVELEGNALSTVSKIPPHSRFKFNTSLSYIFDAKPNPSCLMRKVS
jgi:hypothetical protein